VKELWLIGAAALVRARRFARAFGGPDGRRAGGGWWGWPVAAGVGFGLGWGYYGYPYGDYPY
jgi:hypothetical protein